jgi:hypothetical protein
VGRQRPSLQDGHCKKGYCPLDVVYAVFGSHRVQLFVVLALGQALK